MKTGYILVSGGSGYIGSHTCIELIENGYQPVIVDNLSNSDSQSLDRIEDISGYRPTFYKIDLCDRKALDRIPKDIIFDGLIHFAAFKSVNESVANPLMYYHNNLESLINVLHFCTERKIPHLVFSSSCTVYGDATELPVTEETPLQKPSSPYGNTKQISESIITDYLKVHPELSSISLRYFNPAGAHPSAKNGELPQGIPNNLLPYLTQTAVGLRKELQVFGGDYNTKDGTAIRDYIHVSDLAEAHVKAFEYLMIDRMGSNYELFNLGSGHGYTVLEVIQSYEKVSGQKLPYKIVDRRPGDIEKIWASAEKAEKILGFKPKRGIDEITRTAWEWEKHFRKNIEKSIS
ncbi:MAG: UDP-glucose 4-epimerase GalE [Marinilabiliales bacterium]|nr:MAG: UDP-glucose 4-epimerase GalE [Marinilabiliales bacterium]